MKKHFILFCMCISMLSLTVMANPDNCWQVYQAGHGSSMDLNEDCYIDLLDLALLAHNWQICSNPLDEDCPIPGNPVNISNNKPVLYSLKPDYPSDNVISKLTDGIVNSPGQNLDNFTVGWNYSGIDIADTQGLYICIDLEQVRQVGKISINMLSDTNYRDGRQLPVARLPKKVTVALSRDGQNFYKLDSGYKITSYGKTAPFKGKPFYLDESSDQTVSYKLDFNGLGNYARYVGFHIKAEYWRFFLDEITVKSWSALPPQGVEIYADTNIYPFHIGHSLAQQDRIYFGPIKDRFFVSKNLTMPNMLSFGDYRGPDGNVFSRAASDGSTCREMEFYIDVPSDIILIENEPLQNNLMYQANYTRNGKPRTKYIIRLNKNYNNLLYPKVSQAHGRLLWEENFGPLYFTTTADYNGNDTAEFYVDLYSEGDQNKRIVPIYTIDINPVQTVQDIHFGMAWMEDYFSLQWPDFYNNYSGCGFNSVTTMPTRYFLDSNNQLPAAALDFYTEIRNAGLNITYLDSPLARPYYLTGTGCTSNPDQYLCPSYLGPEYTDELDRIHSLWQQIQPDHVFYDIEFFSYDLIDRVSTCTRCQAGMTSTGLGIYDYLKYCGHRILSDIRGSVSADPFIRNEIIGLYKVDKYRDLLNYMFDYNQNHPENLDVGMPSWYLAGQLDNIHNIARTVFLAENQTRQYIPWVTAGTYGEFPSFKLEPMTYEIILNGAAGMAFFNFTNFDTPLDYYYVSKAVNTLSDYQTLLSSGTVNTAWSAGNSNLYYTAFGNSDQCLLLVGNYTSATLETASLSVPLSGAVTVKEIILNRDECINTISPVIISQLQPQEFRLYYAFKN